MSISKFYRLLADPLATSRWYLKSPVDLFDNEIDPRVFTQGVLVTSLPTTMRIPLRRRGEPVDFNFADFDMVVTPAFLNAELVKLTGQQLQQIPVRIEESDREYEILNIVDLVDCINEVDSQFIKWTEADERPDKVGNYRMFARLRIDGATAEGHHLFRIRGWPIALIASESVKALIESLHISGVKFDPVN